ncbi:MAG TPA: ABC transporter permease [Microbacteriaceae bacterium]|nr:ABC transporter permease [Microbacteriaceae bacterium]
MRRVGVVAASIVLVVMVGMAIVPGLFTAGDPLVTDLRSALLPPSAGHIFGTDQSGRDVFTRVVYGARTSIGIGVAAALLAVVTGLLLGVGIGLAPRPVGIVAMRGVDVLLAFPEFLVALVVVAVLCPSPVTVALAVTIAAVPVYIRLARAHTVTLRQAEHVESAYLLGVPRPLAVMRHVLPAVAGSLSVLATIGVGTAMLAAAGLSFLGLGPTEPAPEWGLMMSGGRNVLGQAWWIAVFPGLAVTLTVISLSVIGRGLRARVEGNRA